jgi:chromate transporter
MGSVTAPPRRVIRELAATFLRLGFTAFGGPAAHIAMMEEEVVRRRGWLTREEFLDLLGATQLIPGPNSTEMAIHVGLRQGGFRGLVVAGSCFILPAAFLVTLIAWIYRAYGALPRVGGVLVWVKPVVLAVIVQALWGFGRTALRTRPAIAIAALSGLAAAAGVNELAVLAAAGLASALARSRRALPGLLPLAVAVPAAPALSSFGLPGLFTVFLKIGSILFGSGYVLVAFLRSELVEGRGWLSEAQLLDAIAVGQVTPGPVFTTATFIGYVLAGGAGAAVATAGIFLPAFVFVALSGPLVPRIRRSPAASAFLDGVNAASVALIAVVAVQLARAALATPLLALAGAAALLLLVRFRVSSTWLVLAAALAGALAGG